MRGDLNRLSPRRDTGFSVEDDLGIHGMLVGGPNGRPPNEHEIGFPTINIQGFNGFGDSTGGEGIDKSQTYPVREQPDADSRPPRAEDGRGHPPADGRRDQHQRAVRRARLHARHHRPRGGGVHARLSPDRAHAGRHSDRRHPPVAPRLLRAGRLARDPARHREPRSALRPQPAAEGHQRREPHAAVRSAGRAGAVARARRGGRRALLQQASPLGAASRLRLPDDGQDWSSAAATASSTWRCTSTTSTRWAPTRRPRACR